MEEEPWPTHHVPLTLCNHCQSPEGLLGQRVAGRAGACFSPMTTHVSNSVKSSCTFCQREATPGHVFQGCFVDQAQPLPSGSFESID